MRLKTEHAILKEELARKTLRSYSVTQYCKAIGIGRGSFYNSYNNLSDLFCNILQFEIRKHFQYYGDCDSKKLVYTLLKQIGDYRIYYTNMYYLTREKARIHICHQVNKVFFTEMQKHLSNSELSNKHIQSITNIIISRVMEWLAHNCKDKVVDVYNDLLYVLPQS